VINLLQLKRKKKLDEYLDDDLAEDCESISAEMISSNVARNEEGLIMPKKLINPCLESSDRQNLHRELLFNQKIGKTVLNQKTELQRALEKQKERHVIAAQNEMNKDCATIHGELGKVIMERAQKNKIKDEQNNCNANEFNEEYLKARAKLRGCNKYTWYD